MMMRTGFYIVAALLTAFGGCNGGLPSAMTDSVAAPVPIAAAARQQSAIEIAFSPGQAETLVLGIISSAQHSI